MHAHLQRIPIFLASTLIAYFTSWALIYRLPRSPSETIDTRPSPSSRPYYVTFCAALASNPHGFPGHCYVGWSDSTPPSSALHMETRGYVPARQQDQIPSLLRPVPGAIADRASAGNTRNLSQLIVITDELTYRATRTAARNFNTTHFKVGTADCVAYADHIAQRLKIHRPNHLYKFPQDYVSELQRINRLK